MNEAKGFRVYGDSLRNVDVEQVVGQALGELAAIHGLQVESLGPRVVCEADMWEHDPRGLSSDDFYRLYGPYPSKDQKAIASRTYSALARHASATGQLVRLESGILIERVVLEATASSRAENGKFGRRGRSGNNVRRPTNIGQKSIEFIEELLAHTNPAKPSTRRRA